MANEITNQTTDKHFFHIFYLDDSKKRLYIAAKFGDYIDYYDFISCAQFLPHQRLVEYGNTWLSEERGSMYQSILPSPIRLPDTLNSLFELRYQIDDKLRGWRGNA